jgi:5-methylcytosine-specific restriction enzyme A
MHLIRSAGHLSTGRACGYLAPGNKDRSRLRHGSYYLPPSNRFSGSAGSGDSTMAWSKESRQSRGYGAAWDKTRKRIMQRDCGLCQECKRNGRVAVGGQCDHIKPKAKGGTDDDSNLEMLCESCHTAKTARDSGKTLKPRETIGLDGWPVTG